MNASAVTAGSLVSADAVCFNLSVTLVNEDAASGAKQEVVMPDNIANNDGTIATGMNGGAPIVLEYVSPDRWCSAARNVNRPIYGRTGNGEALHLGTAASQEEHRTAVLRSDTAVRRTILASNNDRLVNKDLPWLDVIPRFVLDDDMVAGFGLLYSLVNRTEGIEFRAVCCQTVGVLADPPALCTPAWRARVFYQLNPVFLRLTGKRITSWARVCRALVSLGPQGSVNRVNRVNRQSQAQRSRERDQSGFH